MKLSPEMSAALPTRHVKHRSSIMNQHTVIRHIPILSKIPFKPGNHTGQ
ncbi:hypothetical protein [Prosthecochloris sp. GSB1]|nr:hypothetical protein [Prosthecochloris sp. GSB1]